MTWRRAWAAYCVAHTGKSLLWAASDLLTLYILVSRYGVTPAIAGTLFLAGLATSALADLGVGTWLRHRPMDARAMAATALCVAGAAFPLTMLSAPHGPTAILAATLLFRIAYACCDVPHNVLMGRLANDPVRATFLSRGRTIGTGIASIAAAGCIGLTEGIAMMPMLWGIGAIATVLGMTMLPLLRDVPLAQDIAQGRSFRTGLRWEYIVATVIGIVALGALGKAMLHLSGVAPPIDGMTMLAALIAGRTASALIPFGMMTPRRGLSLLAATYAASAAIPILFVFADTRSVAPLVLGFAMGLANLIGWTLLSILARDAGDYGLYTMASKLALGTAGLVLAGGLGRSPIFTTANFASFAAVIASTCVMAALLCLTCRRHRDLHPA